MIANDIITLPLAPAPGSPFADLIERADDVCRLRSSRRLDAGHRDEDLEAWRRREKALRVSRTGTLVGREGELALASAAVRELFEGRASVLVIEGEAGIGKTRLVQHVVDDARSRGAVVLSGQAHPFERTRPFGVVVAALGLSRRSEDPRKAAIAALLAREDAAADPKAAEDIRYRVVEEVVDLIERACTQGRGADERCRGQAAVHVAAHRQHASPARVRQAGRAQPGRPRRPPAFECHSAEMPTWRLDGSLVPWTHEDRDRQRPRQADAPRREPARAGDRRGDRAGARGGRRAGPPDAAAGARAPPGGCVGVHTGTPRTPASSPCRLPPRTPPETQRG